MKTKKTGDLVVEHLSNIGKGTGSELEAGEFIGYGTSYQASQDMKVAAMPLGHSNDYPRAQSNSGHVLIKGKRCRSSG